MKPQLSYIIEKEAELNLLDKTIIGVPFWRIVRHYVRAKQLDSIASFKNDKTPVHLILKSAFTSLPKAIKIFFSSKRYENIVFAFQRLHKIDNLYIDKISDPVVILSDIKNSCIIFQYQNKTPRINEEMVVDIEALDTIFRLFALIITPITLLLTFLKIYPTYKRAATCFKLNKKDLFIFFYYTSIFIVRCLSFNLFLRRVKPKRVFYVGRRMFNGYIVACKKRGITCCELQHGITLGETVTYSGIYDSRIDPDYFLVFGEIWKGPQFGVPLDRIINIGWAHKDFLSHICIQKESYKDTVLFISDPFNGSTIISIIFEFAETYPQYCYHLRLHPMEKLTEEHFNQIALIPNISITDNEEEVSIALLAYKKVVGVNSSVLFEALSLGIDVARLSYKGCKVLQLPQKELSDFYDIIDNNSFYKFMNAKDKEKKPTNGIYSKFNPTIINNMIK